MDADLIVDASKTIAQFIMAGSAASTVTVTATNNAILTITGAGVTQPIQNNKNGGNIVFNLPIVFDSSEGATETLRMNSGGDQSVTFGASHSLTLNDGLTVTGVNLNHDLNLNGNLLGAGNLKFGTKTQANFGSGFNGANYNGSLEIAGGSGNNGVTVISNVADDGTFLKAGGVINVTQPGGTLTVNGANTLKGNIALSGANTLALNINKNQSAVGTITMGSGTLNLSLASDVTSLIFADNSTSSWGTGKLVVTGAGDNEVAFGSSASALTADQLSRITVSGSVAEINSSGQIKAKEIAESTFTNGGGDHLWSNEANWSSGIPNVTTAKVTLNDSLIIDSNVEIAQIKLAGGFGDAMISATTSSKTLTLNGSSVSQPIQNNGANVDLHINMKVVINSDFTETVGAEGSGTCSITFGSSSELTLSNATKFFAQNNKSINMNGVLQGSGEFRVGAASKVNFGSTSNNANFTGGFKMLGNNGVLTVNTAANGTFLKAGTSITPDASSTGHTVTINNSNVLKGNISVLGNPFNLNINANQSAVGTLTLTSGTLNLALGSSVSSLAFANNYSSNWGTGTIVVTGFVDNIISFGIDPSGLTAAQLSQINIGGATVLLNDYGKLYNASPPTITSVTSSNNDGSYTSGDVVSLNIVFNEPVNVNGTPQLTLETGSTDAVVDYTSGSGNDTLIFNYTVSEAHNSTDLDYVGTESLTLTQPNPSTPVYETTSGLGYAVKISGDYAYLAVGNSGLDIIDISDPENPGIPVNRDTENALGVAISGNYAYVADGEAGLAIIDISNPATPGTPVYQNTNGTATDVNILGSYAYVADGASGLAIIDISNPASPGTPVYRDTNGSGRGVVVRGNYAYLADGPAGLAIIDISNPANPGAPIYKDTEGSAIGLAVSGNYAYVGDAQTGLAIIDISNPASPGTPVYKNTDGNAFKVNVVGDYAIFADYQSGLAIIDVSDPANPGTPVYEVTRDFAQGVAVSGDYAYLAMGDGLAIVKTNISSIADNLGTSANLVLPSPGASGSLSSNKAIVIDNTKPTVISVNSSNADDSYRLGDVIVINVVFSEKVNVTGTPQLTLETGATDAVVDYSGGTGTTTLSFNYTIAAEHNSDDLSYVSQESLLLSGGSTIKDVVGNIATLTLPVPGASESLSANNEIIVDNIPPTMTITAAEGGDGFTSNDSILSLTFTSSEVTNNFALEDISATGGVVNNFSAVSGKIYTATFTASGLGNITIDVAAGTFTDTPGNLNLAADQFNYSYDPSALTMTITAAEGTDGFKSEDVTLSLTFTANKATSDFTVEDIIVTGGNITDFVSVNDSVYTAKLTPLSEGNVTIDVGAGAFTDVAGNLNIAALQFNWTYDINYAPIMSDTLFTVSENAGNGTFVGVIEVTDVDDDPLIFEILSGNPDNAFGLVPSTGVVTVTNKEMLDYELNPSFILSVSVSDGFLSDSATVTINLLDVLENSVPVILSDTFTIAENSLNGMLVGTVQASDADGDTLSYSILAGNTSDAFEINENGGIVIINESAIDYELNSTFYLTVQVDDGQIISIATIVVRLTDIDETPLSLEEVVEMVYPNPTSGIINIKMNKFKKAELYNLSGMKVFSSTDRRMDISSVEKGIYLITLEKEDGTAVFTKIIKK